MVVGGKFVIALESRTADITDEIAFLVATLIASVTSQREGVNVAFPTDTHVRIGTLHFSPIIDIFYNVIKKR